MEDVTSMSPAQVTAELRGPGSFLVDATRAVRVPPSVPLCEDGVPGRPPYAEATGALRGGRDPRDWLSYRLIMLLSTLTKLDEATLLNRLLVCGRVDESQSVAQAGVDARHQLHLLLDVAAWHRARGLPLLLAIVDLVRGFPSADRRDGGARRSEDAHRLPQWLTR